MAAHRPKRYWLADAGTYVPQWPQVKWVRARKSCDIALRELKPAVRLNRKPAFWRADLMQHDGRFLSRDADSASEFSALRGDQPDNAAGLYELTTVQRKFGVTGLIVHFSGKRWSNRQAKDGAGVGSRGPNVPLQVVANPANTRESPREIDQHEGRGRITRRIVSEHTCQGIELLPEVGGAKNGIDPLLHEIGEVRGLVVMFHPPRCA